MPQPAKRKKRRCRPATEIATQRESRAWDLRLRGWTQADIARELKCERSTVSRMLDRIEQRTLAELSERIAQHKARQTAQLELVYREAWEAWERSKLPAVEEKESKGDDGGDKAWQKTERKVTHRDGSAEFLARCQATLADIRKIWGMDVVPDDASAEGNPPHPDVVAAMARGIAEGLRVAREVDG